MLRQLAASINRSLCSHYCPEQELDELALAERQVLRRNCWDSYGIVAGAIKVKDAKSRLTSSDSASAAGPNQVRS